MPEHFTVEANGVALNDAGRRLAIDLIEHRMAGTVTLAGRTEPISWRETIGVSARALADALRTSAPFTAVERP